MIKTIILDWGGVITRGRHTRAVIDLLEQKYNIHIDDDSFSRDLMLPMDEGLEGLSDFRGRFRERYNIDIDEEELYSILGRGILINEEVVDFIKNLKPKYRLLMLSDNNFPTIKHLQDEFSEIMDLFEKKYFSSELGITKPDESLFEYLIADSAINPEEAVFVDDKLANTMAAQKAGLKTICFENTNQFKQELAKLGITY